MTTMEFTSSVEPVVIIQTVVAVFLPILVGLVTTRVTRGGTKAVLLAFLAVLTTFLTSWITALEAGEPFDIGMAVITAVATFAVAVATHYGLWKPQGVSEGAQRVRATTIVDRSKVDLAA